MRSVQKQQTIERSAVCAGVGLHSGERARLVMRPACADTGLVFVRKDVTDKPNRILAIGSAVTETMLGTTLSNQAGVTVAVVEHLLAACAGLGVDNLVIEIDGAEVPIMDGSSFVYCDLLMKAGIGRQSALRRRIRILDTIEAGKGRKWARLTPSGDDWLTLRARIDFDNEAIGVQEITLKLSPGRFASDLAFARTFGFARDVEKLQAAGLARGGSLENAIVLDGDRIMNPEGLRVADEFIRHKALDAVGDLMLAGAPIAGVYEANEPGHALNNALVRELLARPDAWCWETDAEDALEPIPLQAAGG